MTENEQQLREALEAMVRQYAAWSPGGGYTPGGSSALEEAFEALGWENPHPAPEAECDEPGCHQQATCGWPDSAGGYRRTCGEHYRRDNP